MSRKPQSTSEGSLTKTLTLTVISPDLRGKPEYYDAEFKQLIKTAEISPTAHEVMRIRAKDAAHFFTKGKREDVAQLCEKHQITELIVSAVLTPLQERNLSTLLNCEVIGRTELILEIFHRSACSSAGKIQVEMAYLEHMKTRMSGRGKELAQQEGFVGSKGPGESDKELLRRYYDERLRQARKKLATVAHARDTQRKQRLQSDKHLISLVGYTNAGKSSLMNLITKSDILAEDKLFATLDTTTRELFLGSHPETGKPQLALLSDTVGFISQLPHQLIKAFESTLDELKYADLLLHVVDAANDAWQEQISVVQKTLKTIDVQAPIIYVFNKQDIVTPEQKEHFESVQSQYSPYVLIDTRDKTHAAALLVQMERFVSENPKKRKR